ncbi:MAG TPA: AMP-binding protein [Armatimonadota bacterium]|jgi:acyl-CoA synthetase (AMP-forming)/AMP-acid ligase II
MRLPHLAAFWDNAVLQQPASRAVVDGDRVWTYAEADALVARLAGYLRELGVQPGDRVALALPNCAAFLLAYWATLRLGAVVVPVNYRLGADELAFVFSDSEPSVVFLHETLHEKVAPALAASGVSAHVLPVAAGSATPEGLEAATGPGVAQAAAIAPEDLAIILYTSGTTGLPKGAMMRHADLLFNVHCALLAHSFRHEDVHLLVIPCFAPTAAYSLFPSCAYLASAVVMAPVAQPAELCALVERWRCSTLFGVPTLFNLLMHDPAVRAADLSSLRLIAYSGSPMPAGTIALLRERFPQVALRNFFGLTETISVTHVLPSADAATRADSIGKLLPEVYARIADEAGRDVPPGEVGELLFRRDCVIPGYWRQPGRLEESLREGWFHTGDLARRDEWGYFYVQGRKKEMIIVAGQNVYALEVEAVLLRHPGVRDCAVIGVPATGARAALGELVKAVVVAQPGATLTELEIKRHCAETLPGYKRPQIVEFRDELPRNATGKVLKREL